MMTKNKRVSRVLLAAAVVVAAQSATGQVRGPQAQAMPQKLAQLSDPLEQPTPRCFYDAGTQFVGMDSTQISAPRKLLRSEPTASGGATSTHIQALKLGSEFWITRCPVVLSAQHVVNQGALCKPVAIIDPNGNGSRLRIVRSAGGMVFKIENTSLGTLKGRFNAINNPHGVRESVWLKSSAVSANGHPLNSHEFYVYLQNIKGYKSYLVEVFDNSDKQCLAAHLPGPATLCVNADSDARCVRPSRVQVLPRAEAAARSAMPARAGQQAQRAAPTTGSEGPGLQTDTGGGHEPVER